MTRSWDSKALKDLWEMLESGRPGGWDRGAGGRRSPRVRVRDAAELRGAVGIPSPVPADSTQHGITPFHRAQHNVAHGPCPEEQVRQGRSPLRVRSLTTGTCAPRREGEEGRLVSAGGRAGWLS